MKLRSSSLKVGPPKPILHTLPATEKITASNPSSFLLQLPQEIKNQIYTYVLGGKCIHVEDARNKNTQRPYLLYPCRPRATAYSAQGPFEAATDDDMDEEADDETDASTSFPTDPHRKCYSDISLRDPPRAMGMQTRTPRRWFLDRRTGRYRPSPPKPTHLALALLRTCRQIYHEANHVLYAANTFCFQDPALLTTFVSHLDSVPSGAKTNALRYLHLHMTVCSGSHENAWNRAIRTVVKHFTSLKRIDISIDQAVWNSAYNVSHFGSLMRKNPSVFEKNTFLVALAELGTLDSLRDMTLLISDGDEGYIMGPLDLLPQCVWPKAQMVEWARGVRAEILGSDDG